MNRTLLLLALAASPALATAVEWSPTAELGIVNTTGNSETTSVNGQFALAGEDELWTHDYALAALRAEQGDELSANRFEAAAKAARKLGERSYLGGAARHEQDDFASYDSQTTLALNYGGWLLRGESRSLQLEGGPGLRHAQVAGTGERERDALLRGYADFQQDLTATTRFFNTTLVEASPDNTFVQNDIGIAVSINRSLALKASVQARHNTDVAPELRRTDTLSAVNIVWSPRPRGD